jgi:chemotaxis methyl-accepting protein methylase
MAIDDLKMAQEKATKEFLREMVELRSQNFIGSVDTTEKFDLVLCFDHIKWIHLNFGDMGVKALFHKVYESLEPNGLFILDYSPWTSYKKPDALRRLQTFKNRFRAQTANLRLRKAIIIITRPRTTPESACQSFPSPSSRSPPW